MGVLTYDSSLRIEFEDALLATIQFVVGTKLRRSEPFMMTWRKGEEDGTGHTAIWIHAGVPLAFDYFSLDAPTANRDLAEEMLQSAASSGGLYLGGTTIVSTAPTGQSYFPSA
jgi:hypothetical protein